MRMVGESIFQQFAFVFAGAEPEEDRNEVPVAPETYPRDRRQLAGQLWSNAQQQASAGRSCGLPICRRQIENHPTSQEVVKIMNFEL